jgi:hypothetical protein
VLALEVQRLEDPEHAEEQEVEADALVLVELGEALGPDDGMVRCEIVGLSPGGPCEPDSEGPIGTRPEELRAP